MDEKNWFQAHCSIGQAQPPKLHTQFACVFRTLQQGRPITNVCSKEFWGEATRLGAQYRFGEWVKVAELVMVMVPGSVEDERMLTADPGTITITNSATFSTLKYIRNPQRDRLQAQHLTCCARGFKSSAFGMESFPYPEAILEWISAKKRRGINR